MTDKLSALVDKRTRNARNLVGLLDDGETVTHRRTIQYAYMGTVVAFVQVRGHKSFLLFFSGKKVKSGWT